jgi:hypothetical protein
VPDRHRRVAGWSTPCWPRSCPGSPGGTARRGCGDTPGRVLPGQPQHQRATLSPRPATPVRVAPAAPDQVAMPAKHRGRPDEQAPPRRTGQQPRQPSQHRPVGPVDPRPGHLAVQHRDLVAQHQQLGVLCRRASCQQGKPPQHRAAQQIQQSKRHAPLIVARQRRWRTRSSAPTTNFPAPTGRAAARVSALARGFLPVRGRAVALR